MAYLSYILAEVMYAQALLSNKFKILKLLIFRCLLYRNYAFYPPLYNWITALCHKYSFHTSSCVGIHALYRFLLSISQFFGSIIYWNFILQLLELSGILTVFFCGIFMSHYAWHNMTDSSRITTRHKHWIRIFKLYSTWTLH